MRMALKKYTRKEGGMAKVVRCRDVGFDCDGLVKAETEEEALKQVAAHAKAVHNLDTVSAEVVEKVKKVMRDE
jgi:predicted small metal-binding protein